MTKQKVLNELFFFSVIWIFRGRKAEATQLSGQPDLGGDCTAVYQTAVRPTGGLQNQFPPLQQFNEPARAAADPIGISTQTAQAQQSAANIDIIHKSQNSPRCKWWENSNKTFA